MENDKFSDFINNHPQETLRIVVICLFLFWQSMALFLGLALYILLHRVFKLHFFQVVILAIVTTVNAILFQEHAVNLFNYVQVGFKLNVNFWHLIFSKDIWAAFLSLFQNSINYLLSLPFLLTAILSLIDLIPQNPHKNTMSALQNGEHDSIPEISEKQITDALNKLFDEDHDGTVLGVSKYTGKYLVIPDRDINQVALVLGTTGSGKTITLRRFYQRAIAKGYPLIIVDGKPVDENVDWVMSLAKKHGRRFYGFNCGNFLSYDPLAHGGYTELKDKIISLKDEWSSDHYRSIAEDYLQTTLEVLLKSGKSFDLKTVVECLNYEDLALLVRETQDENLIKRVSSLEKYDRDDITGLQAHLNILIHSELGQYFENNESTFNLSDVIDQNAVVYFALPALRFPSFSTVLGKLVINDIKAVIDRQTDKRQSIFTVFDEFSVFAGDQVLNLVNMGRGKGVHAIFGTQGLADLAKVDENFKEQIMNCVNTLICHRLNDQTSAETVANWIGTREVFTVTAQLNVKQSDSGIGSVRRNKEFIVHPDKIKQGLRVGEVFYITKVGRFKWENLRIKSSLDF